MFVVIMEWDGDKPPTTYYNRLHKLGLFVRGVDGKAQTPLARRSRVPQKAGYESVIVQEGTVMCASESLAREIAGLAGEHGARNIQVGYIEPTPYHMNVQDRDVMNRIESALGRRGRRPKDSTADWSVTCHDEGLTYFVQDAAYIIQCPGCRSPLINSIVGETPKFQLPTGVPIFDAWKDIRFSRGEFEAADIDTTGTAPFPPTAVINNQGEALTAKIIAASTSLLKDVDEIARAVDQITALRILDLVLTCRTYKSIEARREARVRAATKLFEKGISPMEVSIIEKAAEFDLLDAAAYNPDWVASLWMKAHRPTAAQSTPVSIPAGLTVPF